MSYILEALKRSEEERELGTVPTLATPAPGGAGRHHGPAHPWVLAALLLAALAVAVALYALLSRGQVTAVEKTVTAPAAAAAAQPADNPAEPAAAKPRPKPEPPATAGPARPAPAQSVAETPAPKKQRPAEDPAREASFESVVQPVIEEEPVIQASVPPSVPRDLQDDIEAFRKQVETERRDAAAGKETKPPSTAPADEGPKQARAAAMAGKDSESVPPGLRALPPSAQAAIPPHRISVHVYSADPQRRFVILNSRRMKEGDSTGDGLRLERIHPQGVVLGYGEYRFFSER